MTVRSLRLASGLVLLTYLSLHLLNHALGLISLDTAEAGLTIARAIWHSFPGTILLYGAAATHIALALRTIFERRHWDLPPLEWIRLFAGFSLPALLIGHALATRIGTSALHAEATYRLINATIVFNGSSGMQLALLAPGWVHGCLGAWISLRRYTWAQKAKPALLVLVAGLPVLSAFGFTQMVATLGLHADQKTITDPLTRDMLRELAALNELRLGLLYGYLFLIAATVIAGQIRHRLRSI